jgi:hypothetical protein
MAPSDPEPTPLDDDRRARDRAVIARIAAAERWGRTSDRAAATEPARRGLRARFEREADPDGVLDAAERARRADARMTAHMLRLARASARVRRSATERGRPRQSWSPRASRRCASCARSTAVEAA